MRTRGPGAPSIFAPLRGTLVSRARAHFVGEPRATPAGIQSSQALSPIATLVIMAIYEAIPIAVASRHIVWRDEVRGLTFAIDNPFPQILLMLRHEGHPVLWYLILKSGWWLSGSVRVLPIVSALIATGALICSS